MIENGINLPNQYLTNVLVSISKILFKITIYLTDISDTNQYLTDIYPIYITNTAQN